MLDNDKSPRAQKPATGRAGREEEILVFWKENKIFEKTLEKNAPEGEFVFYEGPPTANGRPGIHHIEARAFKDAIPRYKTMRGFHVRRKAGWDTHGLPVELEVEKELGLKSKKEIEEYGVAKFNERCKENVWKYVDEWREFTDRMGFWVDMDNPYVTYHNPFMESVWNILAKTEERGLLYKDYKVVPWCPRCGTALSSHELAQGYQDIKELSVTVEFKLLGHPMSKSERTSDVPTYLLAWTTTPWTLPGNIALAVGKDIDYVEIEKQDEEGIKLVRFILAKARLKDVFGEDEYKVVREMKGKELVGLEYEPLYPFTKDSYTGEGMEKAYKVYPASFVTTEDGTGIVHTSVMYGQDDFELGNEVGLPKHHLVSETGHFLSGTGFLEGKFVKDEETAVEIIKDLAHRGLLFAKAKYEHSYPFCWRCKTPLIYYARDSWYIRMSALRKELMAENQKINWEPDHIKEGRFGEWLREVKDWAISRERYWGTPLPIWVNEEGSKRIVVDSLETLKKYSKTNGNKFIGMRHAQGEHNLKGLCSADPDYPHHITEKGRADAEKVGKELKGKGITKIIISPFVRTKETAEIIAREIGFPKDKIEIDERLGEFKFGSFHLKPIAGYFEWRKGEGNGVDAKPEGGESIREARRRFAEFMYETNAKHSGETILIISHGIAFEVMPHIVRGNTAERTWDEWRAERLQYGEFEEYDFVPWPHNADYELDMHKPYIDEVVLEKEGEEYRRVPEVLDVWFDSGAVPFAQDYYPFDTTELNYPADFISEAIDQTRGWFYTLHAIGVLMQKGRAYKNVISLGHLMDKEGKKMSKSIGNVVDPWEQMNKFGADAVRLWMYSVNQPGESKNYDESSVEEINRRLLNILDNVLAFYELYRHKEVEDFSQRDGAPISENILDRWIINKIYELSRLTSESLDGYKLLEPARALREFVDDLSTWYLRRSRERIKNGDMDAKQTLYYILKTFAQIMSPFAPFVAEEIWQKLKNDRDEESVHLSEFPMWAKVDEMIMEDMYEVRRLVSLALDERQKAGIKVRQPLGKLKVTCHRPGRQESIKLKDEYLELIKDELNVKEVVQDESLEQEVELDTELTPELEEEGRVRDLVRKIQDIRKERGLQPGEPMKYEVLEEEKELFKKFGNEIKKATDIETKF